MPTIRTIRYAEYEQDAQTHHKATDIRTGKVTVFYSNGQRQEFESIKWTDFEEWERRHWDWLRPPEGVTTRPPIVEPDEYESE